jgi:hypothetical protein
MRVIAFTFLLTAGSLAVHGDVLSGYSAIGRMNEKHYTFTVSQADILRTPI